MNKIKAKYSEHLLVPKEGLSSIEPGEFETLDGKVCNAMFICGWDNCDGEYDQQLEHICRKYWQLPFSYVKSLWIERCYSVEGYWYFLQLKEVNA